MRKDLKVELDVLGVLIASLMSVFVAACIGQVGSNAKGEKTLAVRNLVENERSSDFDALVLGIRNYYGPLEYKENRFQFKFDDLVEKYRKEALAAQTDAQFIGVAAQLLRHFQDGHISIQTTIQKPSAYSIPVVATIFEGKVYVGGFRDEKLDGRMQTAAEFSQQKGIHVGDEILEVDGIPAMDYLTLAHKYESWGNEITDLHLIGRIFRRHSYMTDLTPTKPTLHVKFRKADDSILERSFDWNVKSSDNILKRPIAGEALHLTYAANIAEDIMGTVLEAAKDEPFFFTPAVKDTFQPRAAKPSPEFLSKYDITDAAKAPKLFAAIYRFNEKMILLLRVGTYMADDYKDRIAWYKALLDEYSPLIDVVVVDQTHNLGGYVRYAMDFVSLFANGQTRNMVHFLNADRVWLESLGAEAADANLPSTYKSVLEMGFRFVEEAYNKGLGLAQKPIGLDASDDYLRSSNFRVKKPVLMLIDELAGSGGDIVPALMKDNKLATLFGERTMGLGGTVEPIVKLPNSATTISLTRGLFAIYSSTDHYAPEKFIENNGVTPDIPYRHTAIDFRSGYVTYFRTFSEAAVKLLAPPSAE